MYIYTYILIYIDTYIHIYIYTLLRTTQRRMLRWMLGSVWRRPATEQEGGGDGSESSSSCAEPPEDPELNSEEDKVEEETWVQWIQRCTHIVEMHWDRAAIDDWVVGQRRRKWRLAGHTARREDKRWSETLMCWEPLWSNRMRGHPPKRWTTDLDAFFHSLNGTPRCVWKWEAQDRNRWQHLEDSFVAKAWYR